MFPSFSTLQICLIENYAMKIEVTIGHFNQFSSKLRFSLMLEIREIVSLIDTLNLLKPLVTLDLEIIVKS